MVSNNDATVADRVNAAMKLRRARQRATAAAMGKTQSYLIRRLSGDVPFSDRDLIALSQILDVPVGSFFGEVIAA